MRKLLTSILIASAIAFGGATAYADTETIGGIPLNTNLFVQATDCSAFVWEGVPCWDTDNDALYIGDGTTAQLIGGTGGLTAAAVIADHAIVRGADGAYGTQDSAVTIDDNGRIVGVAGANGGIDFGTDGVRITTDNDGAITFLGLGDGADEDFTINLDDTANTIVASSSTGVTLFDWGTLNLKTDGYIHVDEDVTGYGGGILWGDGDTQMFEVADDNWFFLIKDGATVWLNGKDTDETYSWDISSDAAADTVNQVGVQLKATINKATSGEFLYVDFVTTDTASTDKWYYFKESLWSLDELGWFFAPKLYNSATLTIQDTSFASADSAVEIAGGTWTHSSGYGRALHLKPTWNSSGTSANTALFIDVTSTAVGSGVDYFIEAQDDSVLHYWVDPTGKTGIGTNGITLDSDNDGALIMAGNGAGADEDLVWNFDDVADEVGVSSTTGVTGIDFGTINLETDEAQAGKVSLDDATDVEVEISGVDGGKVKIAGVGNTNNEDLTIDMETNANKATVSSSTGVTEVDMGTIGVSVGYADAGTEYTRHSTDVFPFSVTGNSHVYYAAYAGSMTYNLPADPETVSGAAKVYCFRNMVAQVLAINPDDADYIHYDTTGAIAVGEAIVSTGAIGEYACVIGMDDGSNDYWVTFGLNGTWAEETP